MVRIVRTNIGLERMYGKGDYKYFLIGNREIKAVKRGKRYIIHI